MFRNLLGWCAALLVVGPAVGEAAGPWVRTRTPHFLVEGNAAAAEVRTVATRLEQFHAVVAGAARGPLVTDLPTVVTVFADAESMKPYLPLLPGNTSTLAGFITNTPLHHRLAVQAASGTQGYQQLYREYARRLLDGLFAAPPPWWVSEGLAQFYSTFVVSTDGSRAELGQPVAAFPALLAERIEPVSGVVEADTDTVASLEPGVRERYTAVAWGLLHYMLVENSTRRAQLVTFMDKLAAGLTRQAAFAEAFSAEPAALEAELRRHLEAGGLFRVRTVPLSAQPAAEPQPLSESEVEATLARLSIEAGRHPDAEPRITKALALDGKNASAHVSLGLLRLRERRFRGALAAFRTAASLAPDNAGTQLALGYGAVRLVDEEGTSVDVQSALETARTALSRALDLDPDRPGVLSLLAFALASGNGDPGRAEALVTRAIELVPGRDEYRLTLVELLIQKQDFERAKTMATRLSQGASTPMRRERAKSLLTEIRTREAAAARRSRADADAVRSGAAAAGIEKGTGRSRVVLDLRRPDAGEQQTRGRLGQVDCSQGRIVIHVESAGKTWKFAAAGFEEIELLTYRDDGQPQVGCGPARVAYPVILTWRKAATAGEAVAGTDGLAVALELLPDGMDVPKQADPLGPLLPLQ